MDKPFRNAFLGIAVFLPLIFLVHQAHADGTCYAPAPVDCSTLSASECAQQDAMYQSEASIYNTCIANSYATDQQNSATEARIRTYCTGSNAQACIASYDACQVSAPLNGFGQPNGSSCTYTCNTGYYLDVSGLCDPEGKATTPTPTPAPVPTVTPTPTPPSTSAPVTATAAPDVVTQTVVTQSVTPPVPAVKPKSIFAAITQAVTPKAAPATPAVTVAATATAPAEAPALVQATTEPTPKPTSFWGNVANFFAKINPLNWL